MQRYTVFKSDLEKRAVNQPIVVMVTETDAAAYAEQRVREEREAILSELRAIRAEYKGERWTGIQVAVEVVETRGAEVISRQTTSSHEEARIYLPDGLTTAPKPLEKLTCHAEGEAVKITWADVHRINALIDAVEALRKERV